MAEVLAAYGLRIGLPFAVPGSRGGEGELDTVVTLAGSLAEVESAWSGPAVPARMAHRRVDGRPLDYHRGRAGDTLMRWAGDGAWRIDADRSAVLAFSPRRPPGPAWVRVLLDSVLASVALGRGAEALHGGCVAIGSGAVAVLGAAGAGKTSVVAALLERGYALVADDVIVLGADGRGPLALPAPPVMNLAGERAGNLAAIGEAIAELGTESWVAVARTAQEPVPLRAVVLLERSARAEAPARVEPVPEPFAGLFSHLLNSGEGAERARQRFERIAALAAAVSVHRLVAPLEGAPPERLADLVEAL